jgi:peptidylprolyl isomerase
VKRVRVLSSKLQMRVLIVLLALLAATLLACNKQTTTSKDFDGDETAKANVKTGVKPEPDAQVAVIETADYGRIVIELYPNIAPKMVEQFKKLINDQQYDGTVIHRVNPQYGIIQGGDPLTKGGNPAMWGSGSSKLPNVPAEFSDIPYERGTLGAARANDINSANCQFFIELKRQPAFDKKYTVFGRVIDGIGNAEVIMNAPTEKMGCEPNDRDPRCERPADKVLLKSITLQPRANFPRS